MFNSVTHRYSAALESLINNGFSGIYSVIGNKVISPCAYDKNDFFFDPDDSLSATPPDIVCVFMRYTVNRWPRHRVL